MNEGNEIYRVYLAKYEINHLWCIHSFFIRILNFLLSLNILNSLLFCAANNMDTAIIYYNYHQCKNAVLPIDLQNIKEEGVKKYK